MTLKHVFDRLGIDRGSPDGIRRLLEGLGLRDNVSMKRSLSDITRTLDSGEICILHGFWTNAGHIFVLRGYKDKGGFFVNAPAEEWFYDGYRKNSQFSPDNKCKNKVYSRQRNVLFGVTGAILFLQEALGVGVDGIFGPQTESELRANNNKETVLNIIYGRIAYHRRSVRHNSSQEVFLQGGLKRASDLREWIADM